MELTLWSWNVNGLRAIMNKDFVKIIHQESPDVVGIQETKLQSHQIPEDMQTLVEYHQYWSHAAICQQDRKAPLKDCPDLGNPESSRHRIFG